MNGVAAPPVFNEPWEAKTFAIVVRLNERGLFTWTEWTQALAAETAAANPPNGVDYRHWLRALEGMLDRKGIASLDELSHCADAWGRAAARTPHGHPVDLTPDDLL